MRVEFSNLLVLQIDEICISSSPVPHELEYSPVGHGSSHYTVVSLPSWWSRRYSQNLRPFERDLTNIVPGPTRDLCPFSIVRLVFDS